MDDLLKEMHELRENVNCDPALSSALRIRRIHHVAQLFYKDSVSRTTSMKGALYAWRRQILLDRSRTQIIRIRKNTAADHHKRLVLKAFKMNFSRCQSQKLALFRIRSKTAAQFLRSWMRAFEMNNRVALFIDSRLTKMQKLFFDSLRKRIRKGRRNVRREAKLDALVTCFTVVRAFAAWKRQCRANTHLTSLLPDAVSLASAHLHFLRRTWRAFTLVIRTDSASLMTFSRQIHLKHSSWLYSTCLRDWYMLHLATFQWKKLRCTLALHGLKSHCVSGKQMRNGRYTAAAHARGAELSSCLQLWNKITRSRVAARDKAGRVERLLAFRKCRKSFLHLRFVSANRIYMLKKGAEAIAMYFRSLLTRTFLIWAANASRNDDMRDGIDSNPIPNPVECLYDTSNHILDKESTIDSDKEDGNAEDALTFGGHLYRYLRR